MGGSALDGIKVVEFAGMVAGPYCGKLLADLGADVIKVEPPEGDPARKAGPFPETGPDPERSALFLYNNTSKRGMTLDLAEEGDVEAFRKLLSWADVLIDSHAPHVLADIGLDWDAIRRLNPALVYTSITPYGRTGPRADTPGDELTLVHAGGLANLLPTRSADVNRAPCKIGGYPVGYHGGIAAAIATLASVIGSRRTGEGRLVDISLQDVMAFLVAPVAMGSRYYNTTWSRVPDRPPAMGRMQTSDGYVILAAADDHHFRTLRELMGNPEWAAGDEWDDMYYRSNHVMEIASRMDAWMLGQKKDEIHHRAAKDRIPIGPIASAKDVMESPQYESRDYFQKVDHPVAGSFRYAGWPYKMSASPARVSRPAPLLGQHSGDIVDGLDHPSPEASKSELFSMDKGSGRPGPSEAYLPLSGIRVLDFCWVWAGPFAASFLASLGAEVIKVEGHKRSDLMRRSIVWPLADPAPTKVLPNQGTGFLSANMNKKGITLDISTPEGKEIARRLVKQSNVVMDNMRPGAMNKLGLGYDDLREIRPDIIVLSTSRGGRNGPESDYLGFAPIHHGCGGGAYITGYPDDHPTQSTGDVDLMNASVASYSIIAAVHHWYATGEGQFIDYSQCEGVSSLVGEALLGYEMTSEIPERMGNAHPVFAPHSVYKCWGVDRWLALEIHSDEEFSVLARVIGRADLAADPRFCDMPSRKKNEEELDAIIESWTALRDRDWMVRELTDAGLMAAPSRDWQDLYADPQLQARKAFVSVEHQEMGAIDVARAPWTIVGCPMPARCAPMLGQDNDYVLRELLGLGDDEIAALEAKEVIANNWPSDRHL